VVNVGNDRDVPNVVPLHKVASNFQVQVVGSILEAAGQGEVQVRQARVGTLEL
jgi:hypothetical protein